MVSSRAANEEPDPESLQPNHDPTLRFAGRSRNTSLPSDSQRFVMTSRLSPFWQTKRGMAVIGLVILAVIGAVVGGVVGGEAARKEADEDRSQPMSATISPVHTQTATASPPPATAATTVSAS